MTSQLTQLCERIEEAPNSGSMKHGAALACRLILQAYATESLDVPACVGETIQELLTGKAFEQAEKSAGVAA